MRAPKGFEKVQINAAYRLARAPVLDVWRALDAITTRYNFVYDEDNSSPSLNYRNREGELMVVAALEDDDSDGITALFIRKTAGITIADIVEADIVLMIAGWRLYDPRPEGEFTFKKWVSGVLYDAAA
jgi:hypothetical protein